MRKLLVSSCWLLVKYGIGNLKPTTHDWQLATSAPMLILVANLGSTSFKFKLLDMSKNGEEAARGGYERIGQPGSDYRNHAEVIDVIQSQLAKKPDAIGFKAVLLLKVFDSILGFGADIAVNFSVVKIGILKRLLDLLIRGFPESGSLRLHSLRRNLHCA